MKTTTPPVAHALLLMLLVLSGLDQTLLSAALPTIVRELGGADRASWVFSAFLTASTAVILYCCRTAADVSSQGAVARRSHRRK